MMYPVRKLTAEDAEAWAKLRHEAVQLHPYAFGAPLPDNLDMLVQSFTRIVMSRSDEAVFGAFMDTVLVGVVGIRRHTAEKQRHKAELWGMFVDVSHRGAGVGALLLRAAIEQARSWNGIVQVCLAVSDVALEAKRLYEKAGFRDWGREPRALCWQGKYVDYIHMILDLMP